jgi:nitrogen fixation protein FixH
MKKTLIALGFVLASSLAIADGDMKAAHGGVMAEATAGTRAELSTQGNMLMVYITSHHGEAIATKGAVAELTLLNGTEKQAVKLAPSGDNSFMAQGQYKAVAGTKAILKVTLPGKAAEQFRFALK